MIPIILLKGVDPVAAAKPLGSSRESAYRLLPQLDPGDILSARVEAKLPDGSFKVVLSGQAMRMSLPSHVAAGDTLSLTFVSREPRLTFALKDLPQAASSPSHVAAGDTPSLTLVSREPRLTFALKDLPQAASSPSPQLSAAGRLVAATMLQPGELALPLAAATTAPLLAAPPADGARLSGALAQTLAGSGLFYESHQAEWISGRRNLAQVRQEPQARLTLGAPAREAAAAKAADMPAAMELASPALARQQDQSIDPRTVPLVQQQLAALDSSRILLQLEIWPGQWMHWEIEDEQPGAARAADAPQNWNTQLRLDLPQLGELKAALALNADGVRIRLETDSAASAALLREHRADLHAALAAAGVPPAGIAVALHEQI